MNKAQPLKQVKKTVRRVELSHVQYLLQTWGIFMKITVLQKFSFPNFC